MEILLFALGIHHALWVCSIQGFSPALLTANAQRMPPHPSRLPRPCREGQHSSSHTFPVADLGALLCIHSHNPDSQKCIVFIHFPISPLDCEFPAEIYLYL